MAWTGKACGMKSGFCMAAALWLVAAGCAVSSLVIPSTPTLPPTRKTNVVDNYHGTAVPDPYRWLEDDNSEETQDWVHRQQQVTESYLSALPHRAGLRDRLTHLINFERYGIPFRQGGRYFFTRNDGLQNQSVLYWTTAVDAPPTVLLDPNLLSKDGTMALSGYSISEDGRRMAYGLSEAGSDWQTWKVRDVETGQDLEDRLDWVKFSQASWAHDGSGFYYSRFDAPADGNRLTAINEYNKLYFHRVATPQAEDRLVYERRDHPKWEFGAQVTDDGHYLILSIHEGTDTKNRVYYQELATSGSPVVELLNEFDASYTFVGNQGPIFFFLTDLKAPRGRLIAVDTRNPDRSRWEERVAETTATLTGVSLLKDVFVLEYLKDARSVIQRVDLAGHPQGEVSLPGIGTAAGFSGKPSDTETFYSFTSFTVPGRIYRYDVSTGTSTLWRQPKVDFDPDAYVVSQVFYPSKDGTRIPMFIAHKRGLTLNGHQPTLLYGYGGFNISLTPAFSVRNLAWMELGGVYAVPNLRGGGEYGEDWHQAGTKLRKQNVFDDFIGAAEWLIQHHYTEPRKLAIQGGSNGGLLVGACMTQRPDLYGVCLPAVGVMDMLRFQKFTIGWAWTSDYGSSDQPDEFRALYAYSPYHNLRPGVHYPATLVTTADHDDRVVPAHSFKFAARLQEYQKGPAPTLIRIETKAGHGAGKPTSKTIEETSDILAFAAAHLGVPLPPTPSPSH